MDGRPVVTVFGSCRVHTPCSLLAKRGVVTMNQANIFGFVHYTSEVFQQFDLIVGARQAPRRLWPFMNIPDHWQAPPPKASAAFHEKFSKTDVFVVEVSSIRKLLFKSVFLQINRTRELLATDEAVQKNWWTPLVRHGENRIDQFTPVNASELQKEVVRHLKVADQNFNEMLVDLKKMRAFLRKPVLFVSHFNTDYERKPLQQRQVIVDAMRAIAEGAGAQFFDPTPDVLDAGLEASIQDLGHYRPEFENFIAERLGDRLRSAIASGEKQNDKA